MHLSFKTKQLFFDEILPKEQLQNRPLSKRQAFVIKINWDK